MESLAKNTTEKVCRTFLSNLQKKPVYNFGKDYLGWAQNNLNSMKNTQKNDLKSYPPFKIFKIKLNTTPLPGGGVEYHE